MSVNCYCNDVIKDGENDAARETLGKKRNAEGL
jgi:hypothetical protein